MKTQLTIEWSGPHDRKDVISQLTDGGSPPGYDGDDYGLYQIYGKHVIAGPDALLYVGEATQQTFSMRFRQHELWLNQEGWRTPVRIYVGRVYSPRRHTPKNDWLSWRKDVLLAERILIYKYSPHYNSLHIAERPLLLPSTRIVLVHDGKRHRLQRRDVAPDDWQ